MSTILITGGASGLGAAMTRKFAASAGCKVYFTFNRSADAAESLEKEFPAAEGIKVDFTDPGDLQQLLDRIATLDLDILVNNALPGMRLKHFHQTAPEDFVKSFHDNVYPTLCITQQAIRGFRKRKFGKIITILTSYLLNRPPVGLSEYVANKAYLASLSKSWAEENARFNISANAVSPSMMKTALVADLDERQIEAATAANPFGRLVTPEEVAEAVAFLASASQQINGINLHLNGGASVI